MLATVVVGAGWKRLIILAFVELLDLEILDLSFNQFSSKIPPGLFHKPEIRNYNLAGNKLTGTHRHPHTDTQ